MKKILVVAAVSSALVTGLFASKNSDIGMSSVQLGVTKADYNGGEAGDSKPYFGADLMIPAPLDEAELAEMQRLAISAYRACKIEGLSRVDFFYEDGSRHPERTRGWLINEINTMPGFTPISMYPKMGAATGIDYPSLINRLVDLAIARHERKRRHTRTDH